MASLRALLVVAAAVLACRLSVDAAAAGAEGRWELNLSPGTNGAAIESGGPLLPSRFPFFVCPIVDCRYESRSNPNVFDLFHRTIPTYIATIGGCWIVEPARFAEIDGHQQRLISMTGDLRIVAGGSYQTDIIPGGYMVYNINGQASAVFTIPDNDPFIKWLQVYGANRGQFMQVNDKIACANVLLRMANYVSAENEEGVANMEREINTCSSASFWKRVEVEERARADAKVPDPSTAAVALAKAVLEIGLPQLKAAIAAAGAVADAAGGSGGSGATGGATGGGAAAPSSSPPSISVKQALAVIQGFTDVTKSLSRSAPSPQSQVVYAVSGQFQAAAQLALQWRQRAGKLAAATPASSPAPGTNTGLVGKPRSAVATARPRATQPSRTSPGATV